MMAARITGSYGKKRRYGDPNAPISVRSACDLFGISIVQASKARFILASGSDDVIGACERDDLTLMSAAEIIRSTATKDLPRVTALAIRLREAGNPRYARAALLGKAVINRSPRPSGFNPLERAFDTMDSVLAVVGDLSETVDITPYLPRLKRARREIGKLLKAQV